MLNSDQFKFVYEENPDEENERHNIYAVHKPTEQVVGMLSWSGSEGTDYGHIQDVSVDKKYRRRGVATSMLREAQRISQETPSIQRPEHGVLRTPLGDKWAHSTGDWVPENQRNK